MIRYEVRFSNGSVLATEPQDDVPDCQFDGGTWETGAFKYLQDLQGLRRGKVTHPQGYTPKGLRRLSRFELTIVTRLTVDCNASSFEEGATQVQIYRGDLKLKWFRESTLLEKFIRWLVQTFRGEVVLPPEGETCIPDATVRLSFPPQQAAIIDGEMVGDMLEPPMPGVHPHLRLTFESQGPHQPGESYTFPLRNCVLHGKWGS